MFANFVGEDWNVRHTAILLFVAGLFVCWLVCWLVFLYSCDGAFIRSIDETVSECFWIVIQLELLVNDAFDLVFG